jgi:hypothetical protein
MSHQLLTQQTWLTKLINNRSFFQEAMRIVAPDYLPKEMDVLRARTKTTGIYETRFQMGALSIQYVCPLLHSTQPSWLTRAQHVRRGWPKKRTKEMDTLLRKRHIHHFLCRTERIRPSATGGEHSGTSAPCPTKRQWRDGSCRQLLTTRTTEPYDGKSAPL